MRKVRENVKRIVLKEDVEVYDDNTGEYVNLEAGDVIDVVSEEDDDLVNTSYEEDDDYLPPVNEDGDYDFTQTQEDDELSFDDQGNAINYDYNESRRMRRRESLNRRVRRFNNSSRRKF